MYRESKKMHYGCDCVQRTRGDLLVVYEEPGEVYLECAANPGRHIRGVRRARGDVS